MLSMKLVGLLMVMFFISTSFNKKNDIAIYSNHYIKNDTIKYISSNNPGALNIYDSTRWESGTEIPAHDQDFYALKDVSYGNIQRILFNSKSTSMKYSHNILKQIIK